MKKPFSKGILVGAAMLALIAAVRTTPVDQFGNPLANQQPGGVTNFTKLKVLDQLMFGKTIPAKLGAAKTIYIAKRTDAPAPTSDGPCGPTAGGTGLELDPCDGSTRIKFDAIMAANMRDETHFIWGEGTFETYGYYAWTLRKGTKITGAGMYKTTIKQVYAPLTDGYNFGVIAMRDPFGGPAFTDGEKMEMYDLSIDCNFDYLHGLTETAIGHAPTNTAIFGVNGRSGVIHNVRVINSGGHSETFVISLGSAGPVRATAEERYADAPIYSEISGCIVELPHPTIHNLSAISMGSLYKEIPFDGQSHDVIPYGNHGVMRDNVVDGGAYGTTASHGINIAYGCSGFNSILTINNYARNCGTGFFHDTGPQRNLKIIGNVFVGVGRGIHHNGGNDLQLSTHGIYSGNTIIAYDTLISLACANNTTVEHNTLLPVPGCTLNPAAAFIFHDDNPTAVDRSDNVYRFNRVDPAYTNVSLASPYAKQIYGNRYLDGSSIPSLLDNVVPYNGTKINRVARADAATLGSNQSIANGATGAGARFDFSQINFDPGSMANATTDRFTVPGVGNVITHLHTTFATATSAGTVQVEIRKNNVVVGLTVIPSPVALTTYQVEVMDRSAANDYYTATITNATGAALTIDRTFTNSYFSIEYFPDP